MLDESRPEPGNTLPDDSEGGPAVVAGDDGEALFLDEPSNYARSASTEDSYTALDLFADEEDPETWDESRTGPVMIDANVAAAVPAQAVPTIRPASLARLSLLAALTAFAAVRIYQFHGFWSSALLQLLGR